MIDKECKCVKEFWDVGSRNCKENQIHVKAAGV